MSTVQAFPQVLVTFFSGRSESFIQCGSQWQRATAEDEAKMHSGFDRITHEPRVGVYVTRKANGLLRIGFDLWKLDANLRPEIVDRLENRWREQAATLSKSMQRHVGRRAHFSKSFARFEVLPEHLEGWRVELEHALSDPTSFAPLERRSHKNSESPE